MKIVLLILAVVLIAGSIVYLEKDSLFPEEVETQPESVEVQEQTETVEEVVEEETDIEARDRAVKDLLYPRAPELTGLNGYINVEEGVQISDYRGKVVLIDFWTYSCINCIRTLPHLVAWHETYEDDGLVIIGVHTPEFGFEEKYENVVDATERFGIEYPVVQDNDKKTWRAYQNRYWPRKYLIDADGYVRYDHIGEGAYEETEEVIRTLLEEAGQNIEDELTGIEDATPKNRRTPELYAGFDFNLPRGQDIGNEGGLSPNVEKTFTLPTTLTPDTMYLHGRWKSEADYLEAKNDDASVILPFTGQNVNIVAEPIEDPVEVEVFVNERYVTDNAGSDVIVEDDRSYFVVDEPRLYNVVSDEQGSYLLRLTAEEGFTFHAFTFG